ncbi:MAG: tRNA 2-thiouridine(34) synthase MnmA [Clostridia bacterium]|nr:tRNA 2-thiouridine(34) synthase MnmA [Clostridia bacterium]
MKILLGMSGGLDSAYSAQRLIEEGHSVEGAVLIMHDYTELDGARMVADELGIKLHEIDCRAEFERAVISDFIEQYRLGRTPNPCIVCNREVKFRVLLDYAKKNGFDRIATGHYAKTVYSEKLGKTVIMRSHDEKKDQSYMLWRLGDDIKDNLIFPLSQLTKDEIRALAAERGLSVAEKKDSQEICFIPSDDHGAYIEERVGKCPEGDFVDDGGRTVGRHKGIIHYTVGQRKGLGVALGQRAFITDIDPESNRITLSLSPRLTDRFSISDIVFSGMNEMNVGEEIDLLVKVRYQAPLSPSRLRYLGDGRAEVTLSTPLKSVTAGQSAVFYSEDGLMLGGFID